MKGNVQNWLWVFLPFVLLLAVLFYAGIDRRYSEAEITPEFCREMVQKAYGKYGQSVNKDDVEIIGVQKDDDVIVVGYCLDSKNFGTLEFRQRGQNYIFSVKKNAYVFSRCDGLAYGEFSTDEPRGDYLVFMNKSEDVRKLKFWQGTYPDWEYEFDGNPVMVVYPQRPSGRYSFFDCEGREIDYLQLDMYD